MPSKKSARLRVVIDTNVLISGIFFTGPPYWILKEWREGAFRIVVSQEIMEEYERVAQEISSRFPSVDIGDVLELIALGAELVDTTSVDVKVCRDPADDKFIACAIAGGARVIVSGDKHLLEVSGYRGITVPRPRAFWEIHLRRKGPGT